MTRRFSCIPVFLAIVLLFVSPANAGLVLSDLSFAPDAPLVPGGQQGVAATYAVIPAGSATFSRGHELQIETGLLHAQWTIQVTLDGRDAARQTASGSAAFVNGALLSYSTDHDVGLVVTVDGTVPPDASAPLSVLQLTEIDNAGNVVPGSALTISQPVAGPASPGVTSAIPTLTPPLVTTTVPKAAPGFAMPPVVSAFIVAVLLMRVFREH
jgi:hypothetical protein